MTAAGPEPRASEPRALPAGERAAAPGLTDAEARERLRRVGPNTLPRRPPDRVAKRLLRQFRGALIAILLFALAADLGAWLLEGAAGVPTEGIAIAGILLLNAALGAYQEGRAERALEGLRRFAEPEVWVRRDGRFVRRPSAELVPGDVVRVAAGERIPADLRLEGSEGALADESILSGESLPVEKGPGDELFGGTLLVRGKGTAEVLRTGSRSATGRIAALLREVEPGRTPLVRRLDAFGRRVAAWVLALAALLVGLGVAAEGAGELGRIFLFAVALAVAAIPEGLPAVLTLTLALGVQRMARRSALVRRLAAVEALGSVTTVATDKTGTITENRMEVRRVTASDEARALRAMVLANESEAGDGPGDPTEVALLEHARRRGVDPQALRARIARREIVPFESARKWMRVRVEEEGHAATYWKGAPEALLERCRLETEARRRILDEIDGGARQGMRVLAVGWGEGSDRIEDLGLVHLWDPPRPEVPGAIRRAREAGIRILLVTGDHPETALAIGRAVGIDAERAATGADLDGTSAEDLRRLAARCDVFARVNPEHKLRLVEALQAEGEIVAMTGDGVNDAPALKRADVGVAMGKRGSDVAREVASLVLLDDNFATIVDATEEGRGIYENIRKFVTFLFATNFSEVAFVVGGAAASYVLDLREPDGDLLLPLTAAQILWVNLVTDSLPAFALALDRNPGVMRRPPRSPSAPLLDAAASRFVFLGGGALAAACLLLLATGPRAGLSLGETRSAAFLALVVGQLLFPYLVRRIHGISPPNRALHLATGVGLSLQAAVLLLPPLRALFGLSSLPPAAYLAAGALLAIVAGSVEGIRRLGVFGRRP